MKAGEIEYTMGAVDVVENGLWVSCDLFEPDDRAGMLARYEELRRTVEPAPGDPAARLHAEHEHRFNERRLEEPPSLMADDFVMVDHRAVGWQDHGQEVMRWMRSAFDISPDITARCEPLLDDGGEVVIYRVTHSGHSHDGREFESTYDRVTVLRDGHIVRIEIFAPEAGNAMRARYEELRAEAAAGDAAGEWRAPFAADVSLVDLRQEGWGSLHGAEAVRGRVGDRLAGRVLESQQEATLVALPDGAAAVTFEGRDGQLVWIEVHPDERAGRERFAVIADDLEALLSCVSASPGFKRSIVATSLPPEPASPTT